MAGKGLSPRQKMINLMYLVLTALLALNVSAEVLNAFVLFDKSIRESTESIMKKNEDSYNEFEKAYSLNKDKVQKWYDIAAELKKETQILVDFVQEVKVAVVVAADGEEGDVEHVEKKDENNVGGEIMVGQGMGEELKEKIEKYRDFCLSILDNKESSLYIKISSTLNTDPIESLSEPGKMIPWVEANFEHLPLIAVVAMASKMQNDVRNVESDLLTYLLGQIGKGEMSFNKIEAVVKTSSSYVLVGEQFEAQIFVAASDSTKDPIVILDGGTKLQVKDGKGIYTGNTASVGLRTVKGVIKLYNPKTGDTTDYPFSSDYQVVAPSVAISPTKMNVFYIGVSNPVDITASGVTPDQVVAGISGAGGKLKKVGNGKYTVTVSSRGDATINVSANVNGGTRRLGSSKFRCMPVPSPYATVGGNKGGTMAKSTLLVQNFVKAQLDNFVFDLKFPVVGFTVSATIQGFTEEYTSNSAQITAPQKGLIRQLKKGQKVYFENIRCRAPDGSIRQLGTVNFKLR